MIFKITKEDLGRNYSVATLRAHRLMTDLYESLFDENGEPIENPQEIIDTIASFRYKLNIELDLIKEAVHQFHEDKYGSKR